MSIERIHGEDNIADVIYMTDIAKDSLRRLTPDQLTYWRGEAADADVKAEELQEALDFQLARRSYALTMIGMLPGGS